MKQMQIIPTEIRNAMERIVNVYYNKAHDNYSLSTPQQKKDHVFLSFVATREWLDKKETIALLLTE